MSLYLSNITKVEKNKLTSNSVFLSLLEINIPSVEETLRVVSNNEDIVWAGKTWQRFPFEVGEYTESSNAEISTVKITVSNVYNKIGQYIRQYESYIKQNVFEPIKVIFYIVNSKDLDNMTPIVEHNLTLTSPSIKDSIVFTLSAKNLFNAKIPKSRMLRNSCRFKFKSTLCGYKGPEEECDKTLFRCRELNNSTRYGGSPSIGNIGVSI